MKKFLPAFLFTFFIQSSYSQSIDRVTGNFSSDLVYSVRGRASTGSYENIKKGSPYFKDEWLPATITLFNGKQFDNVIGRIDLLGQRFLYKENGLEYTADSVIKEVVLKDSVQGKTYRFIHASAFPNPVQKGENGWYLELAGGEVAAYKYVNKKVEESRQYSSAIIDRSIVSTEKYFLSHKNLLVLIKRLRDFPDILRDRETELRDYISKHNLNRLSDEILYSLTFYYNSLSK